MNYDVERRKLNRFTVSDAKVVYEQEAGFFDSKDFVGAGKLIDLSLGSAKFESKHHLTPGAKLQIWIILNSGRVIPLIGSIPRISSQKTNENFQAVVEFNLGTLDSRLNSLESKMILELLCKQHH